MKSGFEAALQNPLHLHLAPSRWKELGVDYAIYVEPPKAPGLQEVIPVLRRKVRADFKNGASAQYSGLAGNGLKTGRKTQSFVDRDSSLDDDDLPDLLAFYRLIATRNLEPIGYCTFRLHLADWCGYEVEVDEVWLEPVYRRRGIGQEMAHLAGDIAMKTLLEIEERLLAASSAPQPLDVEVCADVYSHSGETFLKDVADSLALLLETFDFTALQIPDVGCHPRW